MIVWVESRVVFDLRPLKSMHEDKRLTICKVDLLGAPMKKKDN